MLTKAKDSWVEHVLFSNDNKIFNWILFLNFKLFDSFQILKYKNFVIIIKNIELTFNLNVIGNSLESNLLADWFVSPTI